MEQEDKWTRFAATGRIEDYLDYRRLKNVSNTEEKASFHGGGSGGTDPQQQGEKEEKGIIW